MAKELVIPPAGESITEVQVGEWLVEKGAAVKKDEPVVLIETDKANVDVPAPADGVLTEIKLQTGEMANVGDTLGLFEPGATGDNGKQEEPDKSTETPKNGASAEQTKASDAKSETSESDSSEAPKNGASAEQTEASGAKSESSESDSSETPFVMPAAESEAAARGIDPSNAKPSGPGGRVLKEDIVRADSESTPTKEAPKEAPSQNRREDKRPLSPLRRRVAERLVAAQRDAALLTTFNEVDMSGVMRLRKEYQETFQSKYDIKLGFMSFFIKATIEGLKEFPAINAEIQDNHVVYKNYYDIGVAVGGGKGLVVPVVRDAHLKSFAELESAIAELAKRARDNRLTVEELQGGTFTITNGGVYGSLLSTPIVNPPQSGILGLHTIQKRPVALNDEVVIRPMMNIALSYDHRIVDGREAVTFLKRIKEKIEEPARILLEV